MMEKKERNIVKSIFCFLDLLLIFLVFLIEELSNYMKGIYFYWIIYVLV